jgi:hypothetical protein
MHWHDKINVENSPYSSLASANQIVSDMAIYRQVFIGIASFRRSPFAFEISLRLNRLRASGA